MIKFSTPVTYKNFLYSNLIRLFKTPLGIIACIFIFGISLANIYLYFLAYQWYSLLAGLGLLSVIFLIGPYIRYIRASKIAQAKEVTYFFAEDHFGLEMGKTKSIIKTDLIKSIKIENKYLQISLNNTLLKAFFFFQPSERKNISQWLKDSPYKKFLKSQQ